MKDINHVPGPCEDEISDLNATIDGMATDINGMQDTITDLLEALGFYAREKNWDFTPDGQTPEVDIPGDRGAVARRAIADAIGADPDALANETARAAIARARGEA